MAAVTANLRGTLKRLMPSEPLRIYAVAYIFEMQDVAREAAELLLRDPLFYFPASPPPELRLIPAIAIYTVLAYRQKCVEAVLRSLEDRDWILKGQHERTAVKGPDRVDISSSWIWFTCNCGVTSRDSWGNITAQQCLQAPYNSQLSAGTRASERFIPRLWWWNYFQSLKTALTERPSGHCIRERLRDMQSSDALREAMSCSTCAPRAFADLALFNELLATRIDAAVAEVPFIIPPPLVWRSVPP
ncbi:hypothetical protein C8Q80DRAFT_880451 [Daedaleopsis nitida]|nr:hypothetical protein C8Q80DRAFT_880451 [Daedaleopsis nitida]